MSLKDIEFGNIDAFNVIVEIPKGSNEKFEYDEESDSMKLNFVFSAIGGSGENLVFPFNYGFIPGTLGGDRDPLDAIVLSSAPIKSSTVVKCKTIGVFKTIDRGETDDKIICVPVEDPLTEKYYDISDLPPDTLQKWTEFYLEVARQKKKVIENMSLENKQKALEEIKNSLI